MYPPPPVWNNQNGTGSADSDNSPFLGGIQIKFDSSSEELTLGIDESYSITVPNGNPILLIFKNRDLRA
jgi:hypothetical protein